jgi:cyanophycin synthetase
MLFATGADNAALANHRQQGGRGVFLRQGHIVLATGTSETELARPADVTADDHDDSRHRAANMLAAVAAGWALGIAPDVIGAAIDTFGDYPDSPAAVVTATIRHKGKGASRTKRKIVS